MVKSCFPKLQNRVSKKVFTLKKTLKEPQQWIHQKSNCIVKAQQQSTKKLKKANARNNNDLLCYTEINEIKPESAVSEGWILGNNSEGEFTRKLSNAAKGTLKSAHQLGLKCEIYMCQWLFQYITESILKAVCKYLVSK